MKKFLCVILVAMFAYTGASLFAASRQQYVYCDVVVGSGDTLWDIAGRYCTGGDIRETVFRIAEANGLKNKDIHPGQVLKVPMPGTGDVQLAVR